MNPGFSAAVMITAGTDGVTLGEPDSGFTINAGASETAAVFLAGNNSSITIEDNVIVGNGTNAHNRQGLVTSGGQQDITIKGIRSAESRPITSTSMAN
jgi:hypothetical protein